ncbi:MAG TPA: response regulator [Candidatus Lokiarchaeia archaeon]|nr:response regulator [Candidatus Lokiarchaeia archaeon]
MENKVKVLVVDDDAGIRETMKDILTWMNIHVITACNGYEATDLASKNDFDLGLIDLRMPGIDGIETFKRIRSINPEFKAFLLTAFVDDVQMKEAIKAGISSVYEKPVSITNLIAAFDKIEPHIIRNNGHNEEMIGTYV